MKKFKEGDLVTFTTFDRPREQVIGYINDFNVNYILVWVPERFDMYTESMENVKKATDEDIINYLNRELKRDLLSNYAEVI